MYLVVIFKDLDRSFPKEENTDFKLFKNKEKAFNFFEEVYNEALEYYDEIKESGELDGDIDIDKNKNYFTIYDDTSSIKCRVRNIEFCD